MLQEIAAVVTGAEGLADPVSCPRLREGGYLCTEDDFSSAHVRIHVHRDGFEPASEIAVVPGRVQRLDVHLLPSGAITACTADAFEVGPGTQAVRCCCRG